MTTVSKKVLVCDNEGCGRELIVPPLDSEMEDRPNGIYIKGGTIMRDNGYKVMKDVFACSNGCLVPAINYTFEKR